MLVRLHYDNEFDAAALLLTADADDVGSHILHGSAVAAAANCK